MEPKPAVPTYILRGHESSVSALHFFAGNAYLVSGDNEGWMVVWSVTTKRPVGVWEAHRGGVIAVDGWADERLIRHVRHQRSPPAAKLICDSHGRDHRIRVWQFRPTDVSRLSTTLPVEGAAPGQAQPWLLHSVPVNALNFCAFARCDEAAEPQVTNEPVPQLLASPNGLDTGVIDVFQLPSERRISQIRSDPSSSTGMAMALSMFHGTTDQRRLVLVSSYEDGRVFVHSHPNQPLGDGAWEKWASFQPHSHPALSIAVLPSKTHVLSCGVDDVIARLPVGGPRSDPNPDATSSTIIHTRHAGQQGLSIRSDGRVFATAGWDGRLRVYSAKTMKALAVLKWHGVGCYATAFAAVDPAVATPRFSGVEPSSSSSGQVLLQGRALDVIQLQREDRSRTTRWLAGGGKDGKISLWDIY